MIAAIFTPVLWALAGTGLLKAFVAAVLGFTRTVVSDDSGAWLMPNVPIGPYRLELALQGFRTYVQTGIVLQVGSSPEINVNLKVGAISETLTTTGSRCVPPRSS